MAQVVNTNVHSLSAQRSLNTSQSSMATSPQRLSSGPRGTLGAIQNRFGSTIANLTRAQIPQQAGTPGFRGEYHDFRNK